MLKKNQDERLENALGTAAARLAGKGLLKPGDTLSQRIPEQNAFLRTKIVVGCDVPELFEWVPLTQSPSDLHHRIYAARPDVGAIAIGQFTWTSLLSRLDLSMPHLFDEQVRRLGVETRRIAMHSGDAQRIKALANGANSYCLDDTAVCLGMGLDLLLLNLEILEKCVECYLLAQCAGPKVKRIPWLIKLIANRRLQKDQREAAALHLRGKRSIMKAGY